MPFFSKTFDPDVITLGNVSSLVFTIENSNPFTAVTDLAFSDTLPAGLEVSTPANVLTDCSGGTVTAPSGGMSITFSGGTLASASTCTVSVDVTGPPPDC